MWDLIIAAVWLLFLTGWFAAYAYARQPKQGTLEWIQMYDRPSFTCLGDRGKLEKQDIWWLLGCLVLSAAYAFYALWISKNALDAGAVSNDWYHLQIMDISAKENQGKHAIIGIKFDYIFDIFIPKEKCISEPKYCILCHRG